MTSIAILDKRDRDRGRRSGGGDGYLERTTEVRHENTPARSLPAVRRDAAARRSGRLPVRDRPRPRRPAARGRNLVSERRPDPGRGQHAIPPGTQPRCPGGGQPASAHRYLPRQRRRVRQPCRHRLGAGRSRLRRGGRDPYRRQLGGRKRSGLALAGRSTAAYQPAYRLHARQLERSCADRLRTDRDLRILGRRLYGTGEHRRRSEHRHGGGLLRHGSDRARLPAGHVRGFQGAGERKPGCFDLGCTIPASRRRCWLQSGWVLPSTKRGSPG